jgi:NADPH2:quinone reductase
MSQTISIERVDHIGIRVRDLDRALNFYRALGFISYYSVDPLGGTIFEAAMRALAWRGRLVVIGFAAGAIPTIRTNYLLLKNIEISGLQISDYRKRRPEQVAACFAEIFGLYEQGKVKPATATAFPLARVGEALAALRERRAASRAVLLLRDD